MIGQADNDEKLRKYLQKNGYEFFKKGGSKSGLESYLNERCRNYQQQQAANNANGEGAHNSHNGSNGQSFNENSNWNSNNTQNTRHSSDGAPQVIIVQSDSGRRSFWDFVFFSWLWNGGCCGGGHTTIINNYGPSGDRDESCGVLGAFVLICVVLLSYVALAYACHKIKNAKLENNKYAVPTAIVFGTLTLSAFATLALLLSGMIVPHLESATGMEPDTFIAFQVILGINAVICALGAIAFFYLAASKVNQKDTVDKAVEFVIQNNGQIPQHSGDGRGNYPNSPYDLRGENNLGFEQEGTPTAQHQHDNNGRGEPPPPYTAFPTVYDQHQKSSSSYGDHLPSAPPQTDLQSANSFPQHAPSQQQW